MPDGTGKEPGMSEFLFTAGIYTLGCKVNQYESEAIAELLAARGVKILPPDEPCDCYIINTCTVTAESDRKARQFVRRAIGENPDAYILVTGCLAETAPEQLSAIAGVDFLIGNRNKSAVADAAIALYRQGHKNQSTEIARVPLGEDSSFERMVITHFDRTRAYIKIEDGCENHCAYCIIPAARGKVRSKAPREVIDEVRGLTDGGCREVVLTGIETASYGKDLDGYGLADLLAEVDRIPGIGRVRLGSLDPSLMKQPFVDRIARLSSLAPHFHLSMQSGSSRTLAAMKRKYNAQMALDNMERVRRAIPDVQFTTDMIVGFPGESEEDFRETVEFARQARFLMIHVFPYSRRTGTVAAAMPDQIPEEIKKRRAAELISVSSVIRRGILEEVAAKEPTLNVLFETFSGGYAFGHTPSFFEVRVPSSVSLHGEIRPVRVTGTDGSLLFGSLGN